VRLDHLNFLRKKERFNKSACVVAPLTVCNYQRTCSFTKLSAVCPVYRASDSLFKCGAPTPDSLRFPGSFAAVVPPVPIPNTAVKRCRADGSACIACARVGRCRGNLERPVPKKFGAGFPFPEGHSAHLLPVAQAQLSAVSLLTRKEATVQGTVSFVNFVRVFHISSGLSLSSRALRASVDSNVRTSPASNRR